ncbi:MAG: ribonuclease Z [Myxococcales bacterium]|nr:ribonuclease Z [Myxococcales bacterium]
MGLAVTILGSGTSIPHPERRPPAFVVTRGDCSLMIDCGAGSTTGLARAGVGLDRLSALALTHFHLDHTAELSALLFALRNPAHAARHADLPIFGPPGTAELLDKLEGVYGSWVTARGFALHVHAVRDRELFAVGPLRVTPFRVEHTAQSFAYRVEADGKVVTFSGDSAPCDALVEAARDADLFVCECGALAGERIAHMTAQDVGAAAARAGCKQVVLTHLYERITAADPLRDVRRHFDGPARVAFDDMRFEAR